MKTTLRTNIAVNDPVNDLYDTRLC